MLKSYVLTYPIFYATAISVEISKSPVISRALRFENGVTTPLLHQ